MLDILPTEVLEIIVSHLPTATSIVSLSLGNRKLHEAISADKYALLKSFVRRRFPSIETPPFWYDATIALTARSRAWDRRAFIARECKVPGDDEGAVGTRTQIFSKTGFAPAIDSYETWPGTAWSQRKEVLAWGAAGRLRLRTTQNGKVTWSMYQTPLDHLAKNDIFDVRILRPNQNSHAHGETLIIRRADNSVTKIVSHLKRNSFEVLSRYDLSANGDGIDSMDMNKSRDPLLAVCNSKGLRLFRVESSDDETNPCDFLRFEPLHEQKSRMRVTKFLSSGKLAIGVQFLDNHNRAPVEIYKVSPTGVRPSPTHVRSESLDPVIGRHSANAIVPLDPISTISGRPGDVFLSGWTDGIVRLYDLRNGGSGQGRPEIEYSDTVDDGQILSLVTVGHEKFMAGSHHNACLKTFDLRMGAKAYSYANVPSARPNKGPEKGQLAASQKYVSMHRDFNIFLALHTSRTRCLWEPLPRNPATFMPRYRGAIYSLSTPSSCSPSVYVGIQNHVIQLDFVSTDDVREAWTNNFRLGLPGEVKRPRPILNLSCYERPQPGYESFDAVLLRKQVDFPGCSTSNGERRKAANDIDGKPEKGWDERWRLSTYDHAKSDLTWR